MYLGAAFLHWPPHVELYFSNNKIKQKTKVNGLREDFRDSADCSYKGNLRRSKEDVLALSKGQIVQEKKKFV